MFLIAICAGLLGLLFIQWPCTIRSTSTPRVASTHTSLTSYPSLKSPTRADPGLLEPYDFTSSRSRGFAFDSSPHGYYNQVGAFWTYFTGFWPWRPSDLHLDTSLQNGGHPTSIWTYHYKMEVGWHLWSKSCKVCPKSTHLVKFGYWSVNRVQRYWAASILK